VSERSGEGETVDENEGDCERVRVFVNESVIVDVTEWDSESVNVDEAEDESVDSFPDGETESVAVTDGDVVMESTLDWDSVYVVVDDRDAVSDSVNATEGVTVLENDTVSNNVLETAGVDVFEEEPDTVTVVDLVPVLDPVTENECSVFVVDLVFDEVASSLLVTVLLAVGSLVVVASKV
jgi:hypothetical protein